MNIITKLFVLPTMPKPTKTEMPIIYPWETTNLYNLCMLLYELACNTGYEDTFEEFKSHFGAYLESGSSVINVDEYTGLYTVTPLPNLEQILRTNNKILKHDIVILPIPYAAVSNNAGGKTVTIG